MAGICFQSTPAKTRPGPINEFIRRPQRNAVAHRRFGYDDKLLPRGVTFSSPASFNSLVGGTASTSLRQMRQFGTVSSKIQELAGREFSYMFRSEEGDLVKVVVVGSQGGNYSVHIEFMSSFRDEVMLIYEISTFEFPHSLVAGVNNECSSIVMPFVWDSSGRYTLDLEFDSGKAPFYLSFLLHLSSDSGVPRREIRTHRKTNFCVPVGLGPGYPGPLGVSISDDGTVNFTLCSRISEKVILCLYDGKTDEPSLEIQLDPYVNRTGNIWHVSMESIAGYVNYGYRCKGMGEKGSDMQQVLFDPYAKMVQNLLPDRGELGAVNKFLGSLEKERTFEWGNDALPCLPLEELVVYRLNVGQFTKDKSSGLPEDLAGTFIGVSEKVSHFKELGVNSVLLEPVFLFNVEKGPYFPYHFFSVSDLYGQDGSTASAITSMKEMIKRLHAEGIEVLMEVVFTHTGEETDEGSQVLSLLGIDSSSYYDIEGKIGTEANSLLKCYNPIVQQLIIDSLRRWVVDFHIDGFCFINSSSMARGEYGVHLPRPPLLEAIAFDPVLSKAKIIADCWSPIDMSYKEIQFPHWKIWAQMNNRFCFDVRNFLRGKGLLSDFATRLCGSGDLFPSRGPAFSFNFVAKNFGLPLIDLVSFSNPELASELSWNCGAEGPTNKNSVLETRLKQIRNFLFILFVSLGVPVLNMGDELGYSTGGSRLHEDRQPIDWASLRTSFGTQMTKFIAFLSSFRSRRSDIFQRRHFLKVENIVWYASNQSRPQWDDPMCKFLAMTLKSELDSKTSSSRSDLFVCFNASDCPETVILPQQLEGSIWLRLVDTSLAFPRFFSDTSDPDVHKAKGLSSYELEPHSCALFEVERITASVVEL